MLDNNNEEENTMNRIFKPHEEKSAAHRKITKIDLLKRRLESTTETWEYHYIHARIKSVIRILLWLAGTNAEKYLRQFIAELRRCIEGDVSTFIQRQQNFDEACNLLTTGCLVEPLKPVNYSGLWGSMQEVRGIEATHPQEIASLRGIKPLTPQKIAQAHIERYGRLLHIDQDWRAEFFLFEIPAAYVGAGKIAVRHYIETLGRIISMFKAPSTPVDKLEAEFSRLEAAQSIISKIAKEEF